MGHVWGTLLTKLGSEVAPDFLCIFLICFDGFLDRVRNEILYGFLEGFLNSFLYDFPDRFLY